MAILLLAVFFQLACECQWRCRCCCCCQEWRRKSGVALVRAGPFWVHMSLESCVSVVPEKASVAVALPVSVVCPGAESETCGAWLKCVILCQTLYTECSLVGRFSCVCVCFLLWLVTLLFITNGEWVTLLLFCHLVYWCGEELLGLIYHFGFTNCSGSSQMVTNIHRRQEYGTSFLGFILWS